MRISLIGEIHPYHLFSDAIDESIYGVSALKIKDNFEILSSSPEQIDNDSFWNNTKCALGVLAGKNSVQDSLFPVLPMEMEEFYALSLRQIDIAHEILSAQKALILSKKYPVLYHEFRGFSDLKKSLDPISRLARDAGLETIDLDEENVASLQHYEYLFQEQRAGGIRFPSQYGRSQSNREENWVSKIRDDGWLNAGLDHCNNQWGLVDRLRDIGAEVDVAFSCQEFTEETDMIKARQKEIAWVIMERWMLG